MKRHRPNASDTISKALLARKLVAGKKDAAKGRNNRPESSPSDAGGTSVNAAAASAFQKTVTDVRSGLDSTVGNEPRDLKRSGSVAAASGVRPGATAEPGNPDAGEENAETPENLRLISRSSRAPRVIGTDRARHYGVRSPLFKLRSYVYKLRGGQVYDSVPGPRDFIWSCIGSFLGIFILLQLDKMFFTGDQLLLLGSFGASCVIIFGAPHSPFAQPRSVIGGQVLSAIAGALVFTLLGGYPMLAAPISVTLAFAVMQLTKTMHPPGGATSLIAGSGQHIVQEMGIWYPLMPVGAGITLLFVIGLLINNLSRNRQYPLRWF